jgi:hypothetical protein
LTCVGPTAKEVPPYCEAVKSLWAVHLDETTPDEWGDFAVRKVDHAEWLSLVPVAENFLLSARLSHTVAQFNIVISTQVLDFYQGLFFGGILSDYLHHRATSLCCHYDEERFGGVYGELRLRLFPAFGSRHYAQLQVALPQGAAYPTRQTRRWEAMSTPMKY